MRRILITGALGQIGSELAPALCKAYGSDNVITSDKREVRDEDLYTGCRFVLLDVVDIDKIVEIVSKRRIDTIYHLAALLSAVAESKPQKAWNVNMTGLYNVLEVAREFRCSVFTPSSIGAFGPNTPKNGTPQDTIQRPDTIYGVTKVAGELLCDYYFKKFGVDTRGVRYPGIVSHKTLPGGGTTDYAVEIYYEALKFKHYTCSLNKDTILDMMYMPDAINAAMNLMEANPDALKHRNAFNITAMSITPEDITAAIKKYIPDFEIKYNVKPNLQSIADSWPNSIDDSDARKEWRWNPVYDLESMTTDMIQKLSEKLDIKI